MTGRRFWSDGLSGATQALCTIVLLFLGPSALAGSWQAHEAKLLSLDAKVSTAEREIHELIEHKHHAHDAAEISHIVEEMKAKHKTMQEAAAERSEEALHMRFEHPEKGDPGEREYARDALRSLQDMENDHGLDAQLDRLRRLVETKFRIEPLTKPQARKPASNEAQPPAASERITLRK